MKRRLLTFLTTVLLLAPIAALAQDPVFVNTEAYGVHKEYDSKRGCDVWKDSMGNYLCKDSEMKPMHEMDRYVHFTGTNNDPDNPEVSPFSGVKKVWDKNRGCYVWKSSTGDFLGTDKKSVEEEDKKKAKEAAKQLKNEQEAHKHQRSDKENHPEHRIFRHEALHGKEGGQDIHQLHYKEESVDGEACRDTTDHKPLPDPLSAPIHLDIVNALQLILQRIIDRVSESRVNRPETKPDSKGQA